MDITQKFIGAHDMLELGIFDVDQVMPAIIDIKNALANYPNLPQDSECFVKANKWAAKLMGKNATDQLSEGEVRELKLDLETSQQSFRQILDKK